MMQNVSTDKVTELRTIEIEQSCDSNSGGAPLAAVKPTVVESSNFGRDIMSGSEDDEASEVDSFMLDEGDIEDNEPEESKFLLTAETSEAEGHGIQNVDPQTQARLEALLEAAGIAKLSSKDGKALSDPEVLRTLTSSVSSALDEAAQSLHRMRETQGQPVSGERVPLETSGESESFGPRSCSGTADSPEEGESLLSLACSAGYYELAQVLLAMKANVEDRGLKGDCTPLMEAASGGHVDIVRLLLLHKADINAHSSAGNTPLHYGACGGFKEVVEELMKNGANVEVHNENGHTPLMEAASAGHVEVAKILLEHGAGINTHSNEFKESALTLACYKGHLDMVKFLLEAGADQEHKTDEMHTALMEASMDGHVEVARLLLDSGAQVNMPADSFESPLTLAACGGHIELASLLIERGANIEEVNDEGYTPLMEAAREGHEEMVALLLSRDADINAQTEETQETALTLACCGGFLEVAEFLLTQGANIELGCSTPLMEAAQEGHLELVTFLLLKGAKVEATTGTGDTALTYACENGHTDVAEALLKKGANLEHESEGGRTPLMKAARAGHLCTVQFLISKGADVNRATTSNDHTVLSLACAGGHYTVVELLLTQHADLYHKLKDGSTMVIEAAKGGHTQVVKLLLEWPNRFMAAPEPVGQLNTADVPMVEPRVPVQGLANIVPPSEPDSQIPMVNVNLPSNIQVKNSDFIYQNYSKSLIKRPAAAQADSRMANKFYSPVITENFQLYNEEELLDDKSSEKDDKTCLNQTTKQQIMEQQQILEELKKVEREFHGKNQQQMLISAQQETEQQQTQVKMLDDKSSEKDDKTCLNQAVKEEQRNKLRKERIFEELKIVDTFQEKSQPQMLISVQQEAEEQQQQTQAKLKQASPSTPTSSTSSSVFSASISTSTVLATAGAGVGAASKSDQLSKQSEELAKLLEPPSQKMWMSNTLCYDQITDIAKMLASGDLGQPPNTEAYLQQVAQIQHPSQLYLLQQQQEQMQLSTTPPPPPLTSASSTISSGLVTESRGGAKNQGNKRNASNKQIRSAKANSQAPPPPPPPQPALSSMKSGSLLPLMGTNQQQNLLNTVQPIVFQSEHNGGSQSSEVSQPVASTPQGTIDSVLCQHMHALQQQQQGQPFSYLQQPDQFLQPGTAAQQMFNHQHSYQLQTLLPQQVQQGQQVQHVPQGVTSTQVTTAQPQLSQQQQHVFQQQQQQAQQLLQQHQLKLPNTAGNHTIAITKPQVVVRKQRVVQSTTQTHNHQNSVGSVDGSVSPANLQNIGAPNAAVSSYSSVDVDSQTESNHDTALTLACAGGYAELVSLLLAKGADIEHRDKKGFTPLILSATAGHVDVVEILLDHEADIEAQSERTKDTPLSLACSGGRYEVVELLLSRGANKEHRNVSDYTPLSLAASGGYVNIIKLLLTHNAEINSRTGSKLGISPLMLAAMNGHTAAVKLLLDMGSDINAQIETNRNTALTLACFQGRHEVVSLLVDRKANIEHRAKTGLTPLMEAASGGYVEVGRVLLDKGADVNAPPVPSSRDTALTIAADKGHYRFVELLLHRGASVDVKNKKGNSPLWLACNGGHSDVVSLLVQADADIDSQDNRKVSCLMAAFRRGHIKVVKWMVKKVTQFPSENEIKRYICTVTDKDLQKKCNQCADVIVTAKDRQAAEANKNADSLLEEIKQEKEKAALRAEMASKRRERRRERKRKGKQKDDKGEKEDSGKYSSPEPEGNLQNKDEEEEEEEEDSNSESNGSANSNHKNGNGKASSGKNKNAASVKATNSGNEANPRCPEITSAPVAPIPEVGPPSTNGGPSVPPGRAVRDSRKRQQKNMRESKRDGGEENRKSTSDANQSKNSIELKKVTTLIESIVTATPISAQVNPIANTHVSNASNQGAISSMELKPTLNITGNKVSTNNNGNNRDNSGVAANGGSNNKSRIKKSNDLFKQSSTTGIGDLDDFGVTLTLKNQDRGNKSGSKKSVDKKDQLIDDYRYIEKALSSRLNVSAASPRKGQKKEEGWKEVVRKNMTKKLMVPANVTARLIGKGGCHINAIREISGAHVEVEKAKGMADRSVTIKGSQESIRQANSLINAMIEEPDKDISEILNRANKSHNKTEKPSQQKAPVSITDFVIGTFSLPASSSSTSSQVSSSPSSTKSPGPVKSSRQANSQTSGSSRSTSNTMGSTIGAWQNPVPGQLTPSSPRRSPQKQVTPSVVTTVSRSAAIGAEKSSSRQLMFPGEKNSKVVPSGVSSTGMASLSFTVTTTTALRGLVSSSTVLTSSSLSRSTEQRLPSPAKQSVVGTASGNTNLRAQRPSSTVNSRGEPMPLPIVTSNSGHAERPSISAQPPVAEYSPFNSVFSSLFKKDEPDKMDFASVAAAGVVSTGSSTQTTINPVSAMSNSTANTIDPALKAKAPGYKIPQRGNSPPSRPEFDNNSVGAYRFTSSGTAVGSGPRMMSMPSHPGLEDFPVKLIRYNPQLNQMRENPAYFMHPPMGGLMIPQSMGRMQFPSGQAPSVKDDYGKPEYSKPHRPMTLPEIKGALNPNAPEFQLSAAPPMVNGYDRNGGPPLVNLMGGMIPPDPQALNSNMVMGSAMPDMMQNISPNPGMGPLNQAPLPQMMQSGEMHGPAGPNIQYLLHQVRPPAGNIGTPNMGGGSPPQMANNRLSSSLNSGVVSAPQSQESPPQGMMGPPGLSPSPGSGAAGFIGAPQRNPSPMPNMQGGRPNSAPSIQPESSHIGPPPRGGSPMTSCPPSIESTKPIQPIGGERKRGSARSGSAGNANSFGNVWSFNGTSEYINNPEWPNGGSPVMTSAVLPSSVITSSVVSGSQMVYPRVPEADGRMDYGLHSTPHFKDGGVMPGNDGDHNMTNVRFCPSAMEGR